jgi:hypothetical protein
MAMVIIEQEGGRREVRCYLWSMRERSEGGVGGRQNPVKLPAHMSLVCYPLVVPCSSIDRDMKDREAAACPLPGKREIVPGKREKGFVLQDTSGVRSPRGFHRLVVLIQKGQFRDSITRAVFTATHAALLHIRRLGPRTNNSHRPTRAELPRRSPVQLSIAFALYSYLGPEHLSDGFTITSEPQTSEAEGERPV